MHLPLLMVCIIGTPEHACAQTAITEGEPSIAYWQIPSNLGQRVFIVVHGGPGLTHGYLRPEMDTLTRWGEVVYYDQRGCGRSGAGTSYEWDAHVEDIDRVISAVADGRDVILVGSSFGSVLIGLYLGQHSEKVEAAILSGLYQSEALPAELERRLSLTPFCREANAGGIAGLAGARWNGDEFTSVPSLIFEDGESDGRPDKVETEWWVVRIPSHDPWFSHSGRYFAKIGMFLDSLQEREPGTH